MGAGVPGAEGSCGATAVPKPNRCGPAARGCPAQGSCCRAVGAVLLTEHLLYTKHGVSANGTLCSPFHHRRWDTGCARPHAQLCAQHVSGITLNISNLLLLYYPLCL